MGKFVSDSSKGNAAIKNSHSNEMQAKKFNSGKISKSGKKDKKQILKGANAWRDVDDRPKEEIALENFEKRKLYKINEKGEKVKDFQKKGAVRPWLDLKFEENDRMTYYEGFFVKKSDVEVLDKLKQDMEFQEVDKFTIKRKMMKAIRKAKRELFKELLYEEKLNQIKEGTYKGPVKVWNKKDKAGITKNDQQSGELANDNLNKTDTNGTTAEKPANKEHNKEGKKKQLNKCPDSIEGLDLNYEVDTISDEKTENLTTNHVNFSGDTEKMEFNGIPYQIMVPTNVEEMDDSDQQSEAELDTDSKENLDSSQNEVESSNQSDKGSKTISTPTKLVFEENKLMTCVEGFWIRRSCLLELDEIRAAKKKAIIAAREDGSDSPVLTKSEEKQYKIAMKVVLLKMANLLRAHLQRKTKKRATQKANKPKVDPSKVAAKKPKGEGKQRPQKGLRERGGRQNKPQYGRDSRPDDGDRPWQRNNVSDKAGLVRFDGYWIKKDAADRLRELKENLKKEGLASDKIAEVLKVERRREENEVKNQRKTVCFSCRKSGHVVADCPLKQNTAGVGSCFKCGSSEHQSSACTSTSNSSDAKSEYSYATCFICRQKGHISRECPRNTRGLYPDGGGCTLCDSNQHLIKDCPRNKDEKQVAKDKEVRATEFRAGQLLEVDDEDNRATHDSAPKRQNKHIKF